MTDSQNRLEIHKLINSLGSFTKGDSDQWYEKFKYINNLAKKNESSKPTIQISLTGYQGDFSFNQLDVNCNLEFSNERGSFCVSFNGCNFSGAVKFNNFTASKGLYFKNCTFAKDIDFANTRISKAFYLSSDKILKVKNLNLNKVTIDGDLSIQNITVEHIFYWPASFARGQISIVKCEFNSIDENKFLMGDAIKKVRLLNNIFRNHLIIKGQAHPIKVVSVGNLFCSGLKMSSFTYGKRSAFVFSENIFNEIEFHDVRCDSIRLFNNTYSNLIWDNNTIIRFARFKNRRINAKPVHKMSFRAGHHAKLYFENINVDTFSVSHGDIKKLGFKGCKFDSFTSNISNTFSESVVFSNCIFGILNFDTSTFKKSFHMLNSKLRIAPCFYNVKFEHKDVSFIGTKFLDVSSPHAESAYRELKFHMNEILNDVEEYNFSGLEINSRRIKLEASDSFERIVSFLYKLLNNYGRNIWMPVPWILLVFFFFFLLYNLDNTLFEPNPKLEKTILYSAASDWVSYERAMYISLINSLGPLRYLSEASLFIPANRYAQTASFIQTTITSILWFLLIVGIRRRFKTN